MAQSTAHRHFATITLVCLALTLTPGHAHAAKSTAPQTSSEGLELKKQTKHRLVYLRPGATFTKYKSLVLLDPYIEFSKTWLREQSRSAASHRRISDSDLERAKADLSVQLKKVFTEELGRGGYRITDVRAPDALILRPALVNIEVTAPDVMTAGRVDTYARSAGQMTLYVELWDGSTNTLVARVVDARADDSIIYGLPMNRVTNRAAADRILRDWARELHKKLDLARGSAGRR